MKKIIYKSLVCAGALSLLTLPSCNYEEINTNPYEMTEEMGAMDGISMGASVTTMQRFVFPVGTQADGTDMINQYQVAYALSADGWSGYIAEDNNWQSGNNNLTYYLYDDWVSATYRNSYTELLSPWKKIKQESEKVGDDATYALAQILKISAWHKTLETFGPIPYTHAGDMALVIPFDSEEEVYNAMFADLKAAVEALTPLAETGGTVSASYDAVYAGDARKWVKYANSLMLRLGMRLRYVDESLSYQWVAEALNNGIGVMTEASDAAQMSTGAGYVFVNNIAYLASNYGEARACTSVYAYLNGYNDPRLSAYIQPSAHANALEGYDGKKYAPVPPGTAATADTYQDYSLPNLTSSSPTYWMKASEVYFLRAEAALFWPEFGSAENLYRQGVEMSFQENGVSADVDAYLTSGLAPQAVSINGYSAPQPTTATAEFTGSTEQKLEKIMIQKWISMYPNGQEAWTEWRRTGYPKLNPVQTNRGTGAGISSEDGIRRMVYPISFSQSAEDAANYADAVSKLRGGVDAATTKLWWDCR